MPTFIAWLNLPSSVCIIAYVPVLAASEDGTIKVRNKKNERRMRNFMLSPLAILEGVDINFVTEIPDNQS
ncbi:hypothetical protein ABOONEI_2466 [Aciduliprofundum boonei T469]|nr:hypothetical protein ABOONEI_2466 [Aciduliprofundum boonei T469]